MLFAVEHLGSLPQLALPAAGQAAAGVVAGFGIGVVAALMGVASGELLFPTIVLLFGVDVKLAGGLSLLVSLRTMLVGFFRYSRDQAFSVLRSNGRFVAAMALGSVAGSVTGGLMLGAVPSTVLAPLVIALLLFSAGRGLAARVIRDAHGPVRVVADEGLAGTGVSRISHSPLRVSGRV